MNNFNFGSLEDFMNAMNDMQSQAAGQNGQAAGPQGQQAGGRRGGKGILGQYGINLTEMARQGKIDPVIGRDNEIKRVIEILNRRTKNNPVLIGEAGVGKTAVVEGLAQAIVSGQVPEKLANKEIIRLDVVSLVQGTGIRGQFEKRMQQLMEEVRKNTNIILFIDEIHEIMGAGNAEGGMDAGNVLKPALARGDFQLVGATTLNEYRKIEKDAALARRFQPVEVDEPSVDETIKILNGIKARYQDYHHVKYTDEAVVAAAKLSDRYIQDRFLPDKAIDLIDEAGAKLRISRLSVPQEIRDLEEKILEARHRKEAAIDAQDFELAASERDSEMKLAKEKEEQTEAWRKSGTDTSKVVDSDLIAEVLASATGIPIFKLTEEESSRLLRMEDELHKRVIGQDDAVKSISRAIRRTRAGLKDPKRPSGSFIFAGPTGVGKTELAKALSEFLFGDEDSLISLDMSEYSEKHTVSRLFGSPPGYVGYEEGGQLTEKVRRKPFSVVLFDEVEKAHSDIFNSLLQILEDGRLTDSQGREVDFKNTIIIMTTNLGTRDISSGLQLGFQVEGDTKTDYDRMKQKVNEELKQHFRPEFLNRVDDTIVFPQLSMEEIIKIVDLFLERLDGRLADQGMKVEVSDAAKNLLAERGYDPVLGARPLRRTIQLEVEDTLSEKILFKEIGRGQTIKVDVEGEGREAEFTFEGIETENFRHDDDDVENELAAAGSNGSSESSV